MKQQHVKEKHEQQKLSMKKKSKKKKEKKQKKSKHGCQTSSQDFWSYNLHNLYIWHNLYLKHNLLILVSSSYASNHVKWITELVHILTKLNISYDSLYVAAKMQPIINHQYYNFLWCSDVYLLWHILAIYLSGPDAFRTISMAVEPDIKC